MVSFLRSSKQPHHSTMEILLHYISTNKTVLPLKFNVTKFQSCCDAVVCCNEDGNQMVLTLLWNQKTFSKLSVMFRLKLLKSLARAEKRRIQKVFDTKFCTKAKVKENNFCTNPRSWSHVSATIGLHFFVWLPFACH